MIDVLVITCVLVLFRVTAFVQFMPPISGQGMPNTVKLGLSVALAVLLAPRYAMAAAVTLQPSLTGDYVWIHLAFLAARETALGAALAWMFGLSMVPVRIAGAWVAQEMGLTMAGLTSPMDAQPTNVVSQALEAIGVLMFFALNMHHVVLNALGRTFAGRPVGSGWLLPSQESVVHGVSRAVGHGFLTIAPVGILLFVTLLVLLITMRTAPQFNFMSFGMTLRLVAGMAGVVLFFPDICGAVQQLLYQTGAALIQ